MHEKQHIVTDVCVVSVRQSVCHPAQLGFTVQKWLNRSRCCLGWTLLEAHGTLCYMGVLISPQTGGGDPSYLRNGWNFACIYTCGSYPKLCTVGYSGSRAWTCVLLLNVQCAGSFGAAFAKLLWPFIHCSCEFGCQQCSWLPRKKLVSGTT